VVHYYTNPKRLTKVPFSNEKIFGVNASLYVELLELEVTEAGYTNMLESVRILIADVHIRLVASLEWEYKLIVLTEDVGEQLQYIRRTATEAQAPDI
jgi:hypothetical protein